MYGHEFVGVSVLALASGARLSIALAAQRLNQGVELVFNHTYGAGAYLHEAEPSGFYEIFMEGGLADAEPRQYLALSQNSLAPFVAPQLLSLGCKATRRATIPTALCARDGEIRLCPVHLDELKGQMKIAVIILNPTFLVFVQFVIPRFYLSQKPVICPIDQQVRPPRAVLPVIHD